MANEAPVQRVVVSAVELSVENWISITLKLAAAQLVIGLCVGTVWLVIWGLFRAAGGE